MLRGLYDKLQAARLLDRPAGLVAEGAVREVELLDVAQAVLRGADLRDPPISNFLQVVGGLVLGCIKTKVRK